MTKKYDVLGIGNAIVDILAQVEESFISDNHLNKGHMELVDEQKAQSLYDALPPAIESSGGSAANTMAGIASLGGKAAYIGKVRDDKLGKVFTHDINAIGVNFSTPAANDGPATATSLIAITPDAERTMSTCLGIAGQVGKADMDEALIKECSVLYVEGYLWFEDDAKEAVLHAMDIAKEAGAKIAFSLSDLFCVEAHREAFLALIKTRVDIVFANEGEANGLFGSDDLYESLAQLRQLCDVAAVTRGAAGSVVVTADGELHEIPSKANLDVIDTTGAGDLYAAGFLYGYTKGLPLDRSGEIATIAASEVICHIGPRPQAKLNELIA